MRCEIIVKAFRNHIIQNQLILPRNRITVPGSVLRNREAGQTSDPRASTPTAQPSQSTDFMLFHKTLFPQNQGRSHETLVLWWPLVFPCCKSLMSLTTPKGPRRWPESARCNNCSSYLENFFLKCQNRSSQTPNLTQIFRG